MEEEWREIVQEIIVFFVFDNDSLQFWSITETSETMEHDIDDPVVAPPKVA